MRNIHLLETETLEEVAEKILSKLSLVEPLHLKMTSNGYGEFPNSYMLTEKGVDYIVEQLKKKIK